MCIVTYSKILSPIFSVVKPPPCYNFLALQSTSTNVCGNLQLLIRMWVVNTWCANIKYDESYPFVTRSNQIWPNSTRSNLQVVKFYNSFFEFFKLQFHILFPHHVLSDSYWEILFGYSFVTVKTRHWYIFQVRCFIRSTNITIHTNHINWLKLINCTQQNLMCFLLHFTLLWLIHIEMMRLNSVSTFSTNIKFEIEDSISQCLQSTDWIQPSFFLIHKIKSVTDLTELSLYISYVNWYQNLKSKAAEFSQYIL